MNASSPSLNYTRRVLMVMWRDQSKWVMVCLRFRCDHSRYDVDYFDQAELDRSECVVIAHDVAIWPRSNGCHTV